VIPGGIEEIGPAAAGERGAVARGADGGRERRGGARRLRGAEAAGEEKNRQGGKQAAAPVAKTIRIARAHSA
jgi:hypothetical protein